MVSGVRLIWASSPGYPGKPSGYRGISPVCTGRARTGSPEDVDNLAHIILTRQRRHLKNQRNETGKSEEDKNNRWKKQPERFQQAGNKLQQLFYFAWNKRFIIWLWHDQEVELRKSILKVTASLCLRNTTKRLVNFQTVGEEADHAMSPVGVFTGRN